MSPVNLLNRLLGACFGYTADGGRNVWCHWQNLNDKPGGRTGSPIRHGRAWLHAGRRREARIEWVLGKLDFSLAVAFSGDEDIHGHVCLPLVALYWGLESPLASWVARRLSYSHTSRTYKDKAGAPMVFYDETRCGVSIHDWTIRLQPWTLDMEWNSKDPWWKRGVSLNIPDFLLGSPKHTQRVLEKLPVLVPMPERAYAGTCKVIERAWKRSRWPFPTRLITTSIDMNEGEQIPFPGKGENSWDCGEDAIYGFSTPARTPEEAVGKLVASVLESRRRHGGRNWKPEPKAEATR